MFLFGWVLVVGKGEVGVTWEKLTEKLCTPKIHRTPSTVLRTFIKTERFNAHRVEEAENSKSCRNRLRKPSQTGRFGISLIPTSNIFSRTYTPKRIQNKEQILYHWDEEEFSELNLVIWISSYILQVLLITNTTVFPIVEKEWASVFLNIITFFKIISLYKYCWKITPFCSFYLEMIFCVCVLERERERERERESCYFFPPTTKLPSDRFAWIHLFRIWNTQRGS